MPPEREMVCSPSAAHLGKAEPQKRNSPSCVPRIVKRVTTLSPAPSRS